MVGMTRATKLAVVAAVLLLAGYGAWSVWGNAVSAFAQEPEPERSERHERMHEMMHAMMSEGGSERMHEGSEETTEQCNAMMSMMMSMAGDGMDGMMDDTSGMTPDEMMGP